MLFLLRMGEVYSGRPRWIPEGLGGDALRLASSQIVTRSLTVEFRVRVPCTGVGEATEVPRPPLKGPCESCKRLYARSLTSVLVRCSESVDLRQSLPCVPVIRGRPLGEPAPMSGSILGGGAAELLRAAFWV